VSLQIVPVRCIVAVIDQLISSCTQVCPPGVIVRFTTLEPVSTTLISPVGEHAHQSQHSVWQFCPQQQADVTAPFDIHPPRISSALALVSNASATR
jgi:hypothetical protein